MDWTTLGEQFEQIYQEGDCDAEWCLDLESDSREQWQLTAVGGFASVSAFNEELSRAGETLREEIGRGSLVPKRIVAGDVLMAEAWLNALRHLRINVFQSKSEVNWRRDQGQIRDVAHASAQLCVRLRVAATKRSRAAARRARAAARGRAAIDESGATAAAA